MFDIEWAAVGHPRGGSARSSRTPGRSPRFLDPGCLATAALLDAYRPSATITYDPNVRPALIDDRDQAIGRIDRLVEKADVVKASDEDLHWIDPNRSPEQIARGVAGDRARRSSR